MLHATYFLISTTALIIATYTDLKERIVSNKLTYALAAIAIILKSIESYQAASTQPLISALSAWAIAFIASYTLYKLGVWAGGDVKLVTALTLLNPINYAFLANLTGFNFELFTPVDLPVFALSIIIYSSFSVLPIGFVLSILAALKHREAITRAFEGAKKKLKGILTTALLITGTKLLLENFAIPEFFILPIVIATIFTPKKIRILTVIIASIAGIMISLQKFVETAIVIAIPIIVLYLLWKLYKESREFAFKQTINTKDLEEGIVPDRYIVERSGKIEFIEGPSIKTVINQLISNKMQKALSEDFKIEGRIISSPRMAGGLTKEDAQSIAQKALRGLAPEKITVRKTMAFVPAILFAYLLLQLTGDLLWNILF